MKSELFRYSIITIKSILSITIHSIPLLLVYSFLFNSSILPAGEKNIYPVRKGDWSKSLNGIWKFKYIPSLNSGDDSLFYREDFDATTWDSIIVPGNWDIQGFGRSTYQGTTEGTGLYRVDFTIPEQWKQRETYLLFDGVLFTAKVYVNGKYAGYWCSAYNPVMFDISGYLNASGPNILAVEVTSGGKGSEFDINDQWSYYGIFRDVTLFSVPAIHLNDFIFGSTLNKNNADISVEASVKTPGSTNNIKLNGCLTSDDGISQNYLILLKKKNENEFFGTANFTLKQPKLWTAETPNLYSLVLTLSNSDEVLQVVTEKVGIREVTIRDAQLLLNNVPVKLRGIDIHQTSADVGNAFDDEYLLRDFSILKKANINFVRTSHYPPPLRFTEICDSMGFYVMEEVPFGGGDKHLADTSYQDILFTRAYATLKRDKNRPSIIVWSLGNENPVTELTNNTAGYVKQLDPTRPVCFPQTAQYFRENYHLIKGHIDIYSPHYTIPAELEKYSRELNRPIIVTEYAHSLGLDMDMMQNVWEVMYNSKNIAGGGIWDYADQGILKRSKTPVDKNIPSSHVWIDKYNYYDSYTSKGTDGIVYPNRIPQPDYFEVKNVYAPVRINIDTCIVVPGKQKLIIPVENRYDFTNLSDIKTVCSIYQNNELLEVQNVIANIPPHSKKNIEIPLSLPDKLDNEYYFLKFNFYDKTGMHIKEEVIRLITENFSGSWKEEISKDINAPVISESKEILTVKNNSFILEYNKKSSKINLSMLKNGMPLIKDGLLLRTGRKETLASISFINRRIENSDYTWPTYLDNPEVLSTDVAVSGDSIFFTEKLRFKRVDKEEQVVEGTIKYTIDNFGWVTVDYNFVPINSAGVFLEAGVCFVIPKELSQMRWIGTGPYHSYPDKNMTGEFGIYELSNEDLYYQGNRNNIDAALFTDKTGNGLFIDCNKADVAVENIPDGILVSHNAMVSGRFNKFVKPLTEVFAESSIEIKGRFKLCVIDGNSWNKHVIEIFGSPYNNVEPYKPFYHSYDQ